MIAAFARRFRSRIRADKRPIGVLALALPFWPPRLRFSDAPMPAAIFVLRSGPPPSPLGMRIKGGQAVMPSLLVTVFMRAFYRAQEAWG
jgi:hypothetical protein